MALQNISPLIPNLFSVEQVGISNGIHHPTTPNAFSTCYDVPSNTYHLTQCTNNSGDTEIF
jgi:hypothetical protein